MHANDQGISGQVETLSMEEFFKQFKGVLGVPFVQSVAEAFFANARQIESLVQMPLMLFSFMEVDNHMFRAYRLSVQEHWSRGVDYWTFLDEHYDKTLEFRPSKVPDFLERTQKRRDEALRNETYGSVLKSSMQVLYSAAISASWTAFECLAADLWVASLNERPLPLAHSALRSLESEDANEITGKQISVGLAAKYGFDLRHSLGSLLKPKYDFTSVTGIQKAYKVFAPMSSSVQKIFSEPLLSELEATRHLIVHRASKVDEDYRRRVASTLPLGTSLVFTEDQTGAFLRVSQMAGFGLLAFVADWFRAKPSSPAASDPTPSNE